MDEIKILLGLIWFTLLVRVFQDYELFRKLSLLTKVWRDKIRRWVHDLRKRANK